MQKIKENIYYLEWDWKAQPNWEEINSLRKEHRYPAIFNPITTGTDQWGVIISFTEIPKELANEYYLSTLNH